MIPVLFALFMAAGAWAALRRNPAYAGASTRSTLRSVAVILLAIGAIIGLIIAAVDFSNHRSPAVMVTTIVAVIIFGVFFLVYVIISVTTPKAARLTAAPPPGTKLVHIHRRKVYLWAKILGAFVLICAALGLAIPGAARFIPLTFGGFALFVSAILLPIFYWSMHRLDVSLTALQADPWLHWIYTPQQWQQWSAIQVERLQVSPPAVPLNRALTRLGWTFPIIAAAVYYFVPGPLVWKTAYLLFILAILIAIPILAARSAKSAPNKLRARLQRAAPEVYFGRDGLFCDGAFNTWLTGNVFLTAASIDERTPRSLFFRFEKDIPNPYGPLQIVPILQSVLIPPGREHDLALLQTHLTERCPRAQITLA